MNQSCSVASSLHPLHRQQLAVKVLSKQEPISHLARQEQVSRKFLYQQKEIAQQALKTAFDKPKKEGEVLYSLPITHSWIFQLIRALILICHCSYRGVQEILRDLFDYSIGIGTIHNRVTAAVEKARQINQTQDLSSTRWLDMLGFPQHPPPSIGVALLDELF
ncbi:MAG: hypothetical protein QNJ72_44320 [Pleurocapsa sp. MO_226.B13]|nr:hypothetical protein [Pleurocapsa sp. MO_226.B13]